MGLHFSNWCRCTFGLIFLLVLPPPPPPSLWLLSSCDLLNCAFCLHDFRAERQKTSTVNMNRIANYSFCCLDQTTTRHNFIAISTKVRVKQTCNKYQLIEWTAKRMNFYDIIRWSWIVHIFDYQTSFALLICVHKLQCPNNCTKFTKEYKSCGYLEIVIFGASAAAFYCWTINTTISGITSAQNKTKTCASLISKWTKTIETEWNHKYNV